MTTARPADRRGFTLAEVLAALLLMAIVVPVAIQAVSVASRAGILGQRKAAAMRVAQRVLHEAMVGGTTGSLGSSGAITEESNRYAWTLETTPWSVEALEVVTVRVAFSVQGDTHEVSVSTLYDAAADAGTSAAGTTP